MSASVAVRVRARSIARASPGKVPSSASRSLDAPSARTPVTAAPAARAPVAIQGRTGAPRSPRGARSATAPGRPGGGGAATRGPALAAGWAVASGISSRSST
ncbi:hypothetical protein SCE1572_02725 [Sorangium cellulosum So0157-2]|uniref:Uncharacterized protein n=1 Tax=Sorangium cellulosum So0157-2 TaxID=1254432 RepID=S4XSF4_SORCE|nr:hypothetical protein SCE1572_02725 [Sorangium cellulosum So0157-2]